MKKLIPIFILLLVATGCANWLDNEDLPDLPDAVTLSQHDLMMLVGDTCRLSAVFSPDDYAEQGVLWLSTVDSILNIDANQLVAARAGQTDVVVVSTMGLMTDTCRVEVQEPWGNVITDYYDMVVYAALDPTLDADRVEVGAFIGGNLRGRGVTRSAHGITYTMFRIYYSLLSSDDLKVPVTFRCHIPYEGRVVEFPDTIYFDGETHGSLSNLYKLNLK